MEKFDHKKTPYLDAMKEYIGKDVVPFDVPGHHMGNIDNPALDLLGRDLYRMDINAPIGMDNLAKPTGVIAESEAYFADAMKADHAFFLINGTTSGIITMIFTAVKANETIILPRNVHKSVVNALIISGGIPVYVLPQIDEDLEIANQPSLQDYKKAIIKHPSAKAIFVIHPTYFGSINDLKELVDFAHAHGMAVLVDEAHGAHFYFHAKQSPITAMDAGADMSAVSIHKTGGSLTQTSVLLVKGERYSKEEIRKTLNLFNTTSPSALLMASLDGARWFIARKGKKAQEETYRLAEYAKKKISAIPGFYVADEEHFFRYSGMAHDATKLVIGLDKLRINGFQLYREIFQRFHIQFELAETYAVLCILSIGSKKEHIDALASALKEISKDYYDPSITYQDHPFAGKLPFALLRPRAASHAPGTIVALEQCNGKISKEIVMIYPPGIPLICPGEIWTNELIDKVKKYLKMGVSVHSSYPYGFEVVDTSRWKRFPMYRKRIEDYMSSRKTTPRNDGYSLPFEGDAHKATVMMIPFRADTWREKGVPARKNYKEVALAIAEHEPVYVLIHPRIYNQVIEDYEGLPNIIPMKVPYNDAWARDTIGIFVRKESKLRSVDFRFNAYGGDYDGLYNNYKDDDHLAALFAKKLKYQDYTHPTFIFEGGAIACDGEGTAIVTEACLLSPGRNPCMSKEEIEENLKEYLGLEKIIWVRHGIYEDETNEHIDNMVSFVKPGVVCLAWSEDEADPQYEFSHQTYEDLLSQVDARGRKLKIHKIPVPSPCLTMTAKEASTIRIGGHNAKGRLEGMRLAASYINYYQGKDFIILPAFGVKEDKETYRIMQKLYPDKKIHQIYSREILLGGGNIHCITMQIPEGNP